MIRFLAIALLVVSGSSAAQVLCPDGSWVAGDPIRGTCALAPDGTWVAAPERRHVSVDDEPYRPSRGGFASGFREGVERSRARRAEEEESAREAERHALELERLRLEIERLRREAEESPDE
jgi:hypothetical protein